MAHRVLSIFRKRLFTALTILSLVLCLATCALWVRSYWRRDNLQFPTTDAFQSFEMQSNFGELGLLASLLQGSSPDVWGLHTYSSFTDDTFKNFAADWSPDRASKISALGFGYFHLHETPQEIIRLIWFPHWFPALLFAILPAIRLRSILRTRRQSRAGLCPHCSYDLRAHTPGDRCPECGHDVIPPPSSRSAAN